VVACLVSSYVAIAAPAALAADESGSKSCSGGHKVAIRSETTGHTYHYAPIGTYRNDWNNGIVLIDRYTFTGLASTSWQVTTDGTLYGPNTYAYCYEP
jgi:hypothetical protein